MTAGFSLMAAARNPALFAHQQPGAGSPGAFAFAAPPADPRGDGGASPQMPGAPFNLLNMHSFLAHSRAWSIPHSCYMVSQLPLAGNGLDQLVACMVATACEFWHHVSMAATGIGQHEGSCSSLCCCAAGIPNDPRGADGAAPLGHMGSARGSDLLAPSSSPWMTGGAGVPLPPDNAGGSGEGVKSAKPLNARSAGESGSELSSLLCHAAASVLLYWPMALACWRLSAGGTGFLVVSLQLLSGCTSPLSAAAHCDTVLRGLRPMCRALPAAGPAGVAVRADVAAEQ